MEPTKSQATILENQAENQMDSQQEHEMDNQKEHEMETLMIDEGMEKNTEITMGQGVVVGRLILEQENGN